MSSTYSNRWELAITGISTIYAQKSPPIDHWTAGSLHFHHFFSNDLTSLKVQKFHGSVSTLRASYLTLRVECRNVAHNHRLGEARKDAKQLQSS
jgi:hypothetical protein